MTAACMSPTFWPAATAVARIPSSSVWMTDDTPGSGTQDPVLLDEERKRLSPDLVTAAQQLTKRLDLFSRVLAGLHGAVGTLSYSCHNLADDREMFPSSVVLWALRNPLRRA